MKNVRRQQKDIDKARGRLFGWATHSQEGVDGIARTVKALVTKVAHRSGRPLSDVQAALAHEPYTMATRIFAILVWLTNDGADQANTPLARYIVERGWRESSVGRRWLKELADSRFELRDVVAVTPETSLRLGSPRQGGAPVTVYEPRLANDLSLGLVLYARMLPMPAGAVLADGLLMLDRHVAAALPAHPCTTDVFAIWATHALVAEGLLLDKPSRAPPLDSRRPDDTTVESPTSSRPPPDAAGESSSNRSAEAPTAPGRVLHDAAAHEALLARVRKLFAMAQETESSPHEAEIALRRCQSLMTKFGITEKDLETSQFGRESAYAGKRVPMHIQFLSIAVANLHGVLFVSGGGELPHFRGYELDVRVARLTLDYLSDAVDRALAARRRTGEFPPGRMAAYDYRLAFADEVSDRVDKIVREREAEERAASTTGTALTVRKLEIVERECGQDLVTNSIRARGVINDKAAGAGREDGSRVSLDPQVGRASGPALAHKD